MKKSRFILTVVAVLSLLTIGLTGCGKIGGEAEKRTLTFVAGETTTIEAVAGETITPPEDPTKDGYYFAGWYLTQDYSGSKVVLPSVMPETDVTYYAKFDVFCNLTYDINLPSEVAKSGDIAAQSGKLGDKVQVKDGADYGVTGYMFMGWSTDRNGEVDLIGDKKSGQYNAGDEFTLLSPYGALYAQWAKEYVDSLGGSDKVYIYSAGVGKGSAFLRRGEVLSAGFASTVTQGDNSYTEFTFVFDEAAGGDVKGKIYDNGTFRYATGDEGKQYLFFDYTLNDYGTFILALGGYDDAIIGEMVGQQIKAKYFGTYDFDSKYNDYKFSYTDENGNKGNLFFALEDCKITFSGQDTEFCGKFYLQGYESGTYYLYDNGDLQNYTLSLNGYGKGKLYSYDPATDEKTLINDGAYVGTDNYQDYDGEWKFTSSDNTQQFKFILNELKNGSDLLPVYIKYNAGDDVKFTCDSLSATLVLNGYGVALYSQSGVTYSGNCVAGVNTVKLIPSYIGTSPNQNDNAMYFDIDRSNKTFTINDTGFVVETVGGVKILKEYTGSSQVIVIPSGAQEIADNVFSYLKRDDSLSVTSVTVPASVTKIGVHAFENDHTLLRATFLSVTPCDIDFSTDGDPFRWAASGMKIVVPEGSQDAYKTAWGSIKYPIYGSVEVTTLPEFVVQDGVLVEYNRQGDGTDITVNIPDEVTKIGEGVFSGASYIKQVNLNDVIEIDKDAFYNCSNLSVVDFGKVINIGEGAFDGCVKLASKNNGVLNLPKAVTIGANAFQSCESLKRVVMGDVRQIGDMAFYECAVMADGKLFIELTGDTPPVMGQKVLNGNVAYKIQVKNIEVAKKCAAEATWSKYCGALYIPSGAEAGEYSCGKSLLVLDGRAELENSFVFLYEIVGSDVTFYEYSADHAAFIPTAGKISGDEITVTFYATSYKFIKIKGNRTYKTADGAYTLICNPKSVIEGGAATLNGEAVTIAASGANTRYIELTEGDIPYKLQLSFTWDELTVEKEYSDYYKRNITAPDGSVLNLHYTKSNIYVFGDIKIVVGRDDTSGADVYMNPNSDYGVRAVKVDEHTFTFVRDYTFGGVSKNYDITIVVSSDFTTFTYSYSVSD